MAETSTITRESNDVRIGVAAFGACVPSFSCD
jgi:hypothetical protein